MNEIVINLRAVDRKRLDSLHERTTTNLDHPAHSAKRFDGVNTDRTLTLRIRFLRVPLRHTTGKRF